jgi:phosphatidylglycerol:prolipoprotein diacylglycerol transferase
VTDGSGHARWPAVPVEAGFNIIMLGVIVWLRRARLLPGQHFHLYLIGYGAFRFFHEFLRDEPRVLGRFTGYQIAALAVLALGLARFISRTRRVSTPPDSSLSAIQTIKPGSDYGTATVK